MNKTMKLSIAGVTVVLALGGALYTVTRTTASNQKTVTPTSSTSAKPSVTIQAQASRPLYSTVQQQIYQLAYQVVHNPPQTTFDASSFTQYVYAKAGVTLPRTILEQSQIGRKIMHRRNLQEGDLVFFNLDPAQSQVTFVGIYLSNGQVAADTLQGLQVFTINSGYWANKFQFGERVV